MSDDPRDTGPTLTTVTREAAAEATRLYFSPIAAAGRWLSQALPGLIPRFKRTARREHDDLVELRGRVIPGRKERAVLIGTLLELSSTIEILRREAPFWTESARRLEEAVRRVQESASISEDELEERLDQMTAPQSRAEYLAFQSEESKVEASWRESLPLAPGASRSQEDSPRVRLVEEKSLGKSRIRLILELAPDVIEQLVEMTGIPRDEIPSLIATVLRSAAEGRASSEEKSGLPPKTK